MNRTSYALAGLGLAALGLVGCEIVLGLDEREVYKDADASLGGSGGVGGQGGEAGAAEAGPDAPLLPSGCKPPGKEAGNAFVRIGNFIAGTAITRVDFCFKPQDTASWATVKPTIQFWGADCPKGLGYRDLTAQFYLPGGGYDVKLINAGDSCEATEVAPLLTQVSIENNKSNEILAFGDGSTNLLKKFLESRASGSNAFKIRFLHAAPGAGPYDFGLANAASGDAGPGNGWLAKFFGDVEYTTHASPQETSAAGVIDANGYVEPQLMSSKYLLGAANTGADPDAGPPQMSLLKESMITTGGAYTVFATGMEGSTAFPKQLWTCSETASTGTDKMFAECGDGLPKDLTIDTFNTQLNGAFSMYESQRRQPIFDALSNLDSDVVCVTEIWNNADKQALADQAKAKYPHSYFTDHSWETPVDDPADKDGVIPPEYTTAPCAASVDKMNAAIDCLRDNCMGGNEDGKPDDTFKDCIMNCAQTGLIPLISGEPEDRACWSCLFTQFASYESSAWTRDQCQNNPKARYVFRGNDGVMMLSKYPFKGTPEAFVLPATEWRVTVLRAPVQVTEGGPVVDTYCTVLTTPSTSCLTRPYTGQYGGGGTAMECTKQWAAELELQAGKLVNYVSQSSSGVNARAVVAGDFYTGQDYKAGDIEVLKAAYPEAYQKLRARFEEAVPIGYTPECTYCPADNAIITKPGTPTVGNNTWTSKNFLWNYPVPLVQSAATILKDANIDVGLKDGDGNTILIPLSQFWGFRSKIRMYP